LTGALEVLRREISVSWGDLSEGKKREEEEECWGFIGEGTECPLWSRGSGITGEISGDGFQRGKGNCSGKKVILTGGLHLSVGGRNKKGGTGSGRLIGPCRLGRWAALVQNPFFSSSIFYSFLFLFFFISLAIKFQMQSNQNGKFSKIQINITKQYKT
jgi:hypothetical protein